jgi:serine/threonine-protein kinase RsbW
LTISETTNTQETEQAGGNDLVLSSRIESIDEAAMAAAQAATESGVGEDSLFGIDLAMREAMANAVKHGNKLDETKKVRISFEKKPDAFEITIRDEGEGFDFENLPDPTDPANLLKASGRGAFLMRNFMDEVQWQLHPQGGTVVKMTKRF